MDEVWLAGFRSWLVDVTAVTFDVFDTALTRIVDAPVDVFAIAEATLTQKYGSAFSGYAVRREAGERKAREIAQRENRAEVTLCEIITAIVLDRPDYKFFQSEMIEAELEAERLTCFAVPEIVEAVRICTGQGIRVAFVSDMYLSADMIRTLLLSAGYDGTQPLLVSSETGCSKADGRQWSAVQALFGPDARILHIGDNEWSDVITPQQAGLKALVFPRARSDIRRGGPLTPEVLPYSCVTRDSVLRTATVRGEATATRTMSTLGASWGAMVVGSFMRWLARRAQDLGLTHLYFCARDGWLLWQAWKALDLDKKTGIPSSYLYVSRRSVNLGALTTGCRPDCLSDHALAVLGHVPRQETLRNVLNRGGLLDLPPLVEDAISVFGSLDATICGETDSAEVQACLQRHARIVCAHLRQSMTNALCYFRQEGLHEGRPGIVDIGWHASMQASIADILREGGHSPMLYGLYVGLRQAAQSNRIRAGWLEGAFSNDYMQTEHLYGLFNAVATLENALSSPEGTTLGYDWRDGRMQPVLAERCPDVCQYKELIAPFQQATLHAMERIFSGTHPLGLTGEDLTLAGGEAAISRLSLSPTTDELTVLGSIRHSPDLAHAHVATLIPELQSGAVIGSHLELWRREWAVGSALAALRRCGNPEKRELLANDIRRQCGYYDSRTLRQFT